MGMDQLTHCWNKISVSILAQVSSQEEACIATDQDHQQTAISPLAVPSIASPGAMLAAVLLTENARFDFWQQVQTVFVLMSVLMVVLLLMLMASGIHRLIGNGGASVISRVMGMILAAVATTNVLTGLRGYFGI